MVPTHGLGSMDLYVGTFTGCLGLIQSPTDRPHPDWQDATFAHKTLELQQASKGIGFMPEFPGSAPEQGRTTLKIAAPSISVPSVLIPSPILPSYSSLQCGRSYSKVSNTLHDQGEIKIHFFLLGCGAGGILCGGRGSFRSPAGSGSTRELWDGPHHILPAARPASRTLAA
jgi:hypothetical protein